MLTLSLRKTGSSYALDFLKEFWPPDKAVHHVIWMLTHTGALKTSLLSLKDKHVLLSLPYLLASLEHRSIGLVFKGVVFLSVHYYVNTLFSPRLT